MMTALVRPDRAPRRGDALGLPHAIAQHLAAAEHALVAVMRQVALDGGPEVGIAEADAIPVVGP